MPDTVIPDIELLLPYENKVMRDEWREYFKIKRQCWLATLQNFPALWKLFLQLDQIFLRGFADCEKNPQPDDILPLLLFIKSHQSMRVSAEVGFATHLTQAYDLARTAIESAVIAHKIHREPALATVWACRDDGKKELESFKNAFERKKKENLFPERLTFLAELHCIYGEFSDWGSHTTIPSLAHNRRSTDDESYHYEKITYTEADPKKIATALHYVISAFALIERAFHDAFSARLKLDIELQKIRARFPQNMKAVSSALVKQFDIQALIIVPKS